MSMIDDKEITQAAAGITINVWPDGTWCWSHELPANAADKSDDYTIISVPEWGDENDCDAIAAIIKRDGKITEENLCHIWGI